MPWIRKLFGIMIILDGNKHRLMPWVLTLYLDMGCHNKHGSHSQVQLTNCSLISKQRCVDALYVILTVPA